MSYDIAVIGAGPAGLSAAVQARARNKRVLVVGGDRRDGPLYKAERVDNYLGLPHIPGGELLSRFEAQAAEQGVERKTGRALNIMPMGGKFYISIGSDVEEAGAIILATGVAHGKKYPGEAERLGAGVSYCATCDGMLYRGKDVVVVGKSGEAPAEANYLREIGCNVTYVSGKAPEGLDADIPFVKAARLEITGAPGSLALRADAMQLPCACVFILRAAVAPTDLLPGLALEGGYVAVDRCMRTNIPGVFAAGDCTGLPLQVSKAVGEGLVAGHRAAEYLDRNKETI
ncbi:thioredoxin reductase [Oscillospiraceae bacterium]|nr:thioredoxin reductase [Oscillospiraceae bacterium]BDF75610.1 thioredoxin reductase [Oscillospiraceae bacterium]